MMYSLFSRCFYIREAKDEHVYGLWLFLTIFGLFFGLFWPIFEHEVQVGFSHLLELVGGQKHVADSI